MDDDQRDPGELETTSDDPLEETEEEEGDGIAELTDEEEYESGDEEDEGGMM